MLLEYKQPVPCGFKKENFKKNSSSSNSYCAKNLMCKNKKEAKGKQKFSVAKAAKQ